MKRSTARTAVAATVLAAGLTAPAAGAMAAHTAAAAKTTKTTSKTVKFTGSFDDNRWGGVQVAVYVKKGKITNIKAAIDPHTDRSVFIDEQAIPILRQEALQAQSARIDEVSGATDTSDSFIASLQSAIKKAQHQKALK